MFVIAKHLQKCVNYTFCRNSNGPNWFQVIQIYPNDIFVDVDWMLFHVQVLNPPTPIALRPLAAKSTEEAKKASLPCSWNLRNLFNRKFPTQGVVQTCTDACAEESFLATNVLILFLTSKVPGI